MILAALASGFSVRLATDAVALGAAGGPVVVANLEVAGLERRRGRRLGVVLDDPALEIAAADVRHGSAVVLQAGAQLRLVGRAIDLQDRLRGARLERLLGGRVAPVQALAQPRLERVVGRRAGQAVRGEASGQRRGARRRRAAIAALVTDRRTATVTASVVSAAAMAAAPGPTALAALAAWPGQRLDKATRFAKQALEACAKPVDHGRRATAR